MWHKATAALQEQGKVQMVGIIQEQHPDRARLFMQWKRMDWPILVDALNLLRVSAVPITLLIDEFGIIAKVNPRRSNAEDEIKAFLGTKSQNGGAGSNPENNAVVKAPAMAESSPEQRADRLILWENPSGIDEAISAYREALAKAPNSGPLHFRLGVAYRLRYDFLTHHPEDFQSAVENWARALEIDPNQYIWRRRIQQYGPRLDKPYPFYDWVLTARREITERGEQPVDLLVEPGGAEYARPSKQFHDQNNRVKEPDPSGRITRDKGEFISARTVVVSSTNKKDFAVRVHIQFTPNKKTEAHWNNEVDDLQLWIAPPEGWAVNSSSVTVGGPKSAVSQETRKIEFELKSLQASDAKSVLVPTYALYYVCEGVNGTCLYRRQDIEIEVGLQ